MQPRTRAYLLFTFIGLPAIVLLIPSVGWGLCGAWGYGCIAAYYRDDDEDRWGRNRFFDIRAPRR